MTEGFLVVDKPSGITSHDVVAAVRRVTGIRKAGHTGTLDPMATGVVVVAIGRVTRLIRFLQDGDKEYDATAVFGVRTDTLDADGEELERRPMDVDEHDVRAMLPRFRGDIMQVPPMVSALKRDGTRLYELARQGIEVDRPARPVVVHELELLSVGPGPHPEVRFRVVCGKGTYVRSLADDMARALGGFAHLTSLRRTRTGPLGLDRAVTIDALDDWERRIVPAGEALADLPRLDVDDDAARLVGSGRPIPADHITGPLRVTRPDGTLLAVYAGDGRTARPEVVLA